MTSTAPTPAGDGKNRTVALACAVFIGTMFGAAYAAVPLYELFCRATGFGGTTQVAASAPGAVSDRLITVRFDANVSNGLPWRFVPVQPSMQVRFGEPYVAHFRATNPTARTITGTASYNVTPQTTGVYFNKIDCFCFTEQELRAGESADLVVSFYVDPSLLADASTRDIDTITLSYTFFAARTPPKPVASATIPEPAVVR